MCPKTLNPVTSYTQSIKDALEQETETKEMNDVLYVSLIEIQHKDLQSVSPIVISDLFFVWNNPERRVDRSYWLTISK
jgi:hypothetical protein